MNVLEINNLSKQYKNKKAVQSLDFALESGKCTALLGPNGAGKTTTLNMIAGLLTSTTGEIQSPLLHPKQDLRTLIGFLPQYPSFYGWMSGEEYMMFAGEICGLEKKEAATRTAELLQLVSLEDGKKRKISQYSGGMRQRLGIAQALIHKPKLILLDEPVSALDPFGRREVLELMKKLKEETTILFSTHILNDAEEVSDHVLFMNEGKIIEAGSLQDVKKRNAENLINLQFIDAASLYMPLFNKYKVNVNRDTLVIEVQDIEEAKKDILQIILREQLPLIKFEMSDVSLEEIFMKVVKK
ncbi:ABC transporter ATP-binding protein [Lederbergia lenta]|uniref:Multidrug ABC transporter ATP-binding protein n=1 Tax=Lederbergia lenta TaxID=1467 RepID=A0A2X4YWB0_LEDLE|nr:ABC transporter ATP-binding protein [Lederbergia lenta]MEC2323536.1 ABC transporter ATP-binding protein [Lederbergia lenta]SQI52624.1 multidrug ABC transporter ATP-binding protein [Lederbergia lenta]